MRVHALRTRDGGNLTFELEVSDPSFRRLDRDDEELHVPLG